MHEDGQGSRKAFSAGYLAGLVELLRSLDLAAIDGLLRELERVRETGGTVFLAGNGGSAATAAHMANDLCALALKRPGSRPLRAVSLCDNTALLTAIANDDGYDRVFEDQLRVQYRPGDALLVISASGNSANVVRAAAHVRREGGVVLGLLGFDGGALAALCDVAVVARTDTGRYGPVEDVHTVLDHLATAWLARP